MGKRVLDVGNCNPDHASIKRLIQQHFDAEVVRAHSHDSALAELCRASFDLVLVNRLMDADGSPGIDIIKSIKQDVQLVGTPVMMISNYPDHQQTAIAAGAVPGFGKAALDDSATIEMLGAHLASCPPSAG